MKTQPPSPAPPPPADWRDTTHASRRLALAGAAIVLLFAGLAGVFTWQLRSRTLASLVARDLGVLADLVHLRLEAAEPDLLLDDELPPELLVPAQLAEISQLHGVAGMRFYDRAGELTDAVPLGFVGDVLTPAAAQALATRAGGAGEFLPEAEPRRFFAGGDATPVPLLRVQLPLTLPASGMAAGLAEFLLDGSSLAQQRRALDAHLRRQAGLLLGAGLVVAALVWLRAARRLHRSARVLAENQQRLLRTNADLTLAVKSSAIGAITAHLLHELKNQLASLDAFVRAGAGAPATLAPADWQAAGAATRRMRNLAAEIADVLRSIEAGDALDLSAAEMAAAVRDRHDALARERSVTVSLSAPADVQVEGRQAQLALLVLSCLVRNALEASPRGATIEFAAQRLADGTLEWRVTDAGAGLPESVLARLFRPVRSDKPDGTGLGLAIAAQIAAHLGARLALAETSPLGTSFTFALAPSAWPATTGGAPARAATRHPEASPAAARPPAPPLSAPPLQS